VTGGRAGFASGVDAGKWSRCVRSCFWTFPRKLKAVGYTFSAARIGSSPFESTASSRTATRVAAAATIFGMKKAG
jgi:hypothetical protein